MRATRFIVLAVLLLSSSFAAAQDGLDCFAVIAGRGATADGSVLYAHNEDDNGTPVLHHWKIGRRAPAKGAMIRLGCGGKVAAAPTNHAHLWSQMPGFHYSDAYLNEHGVAVASNACPSREARPDLTEGGIGRMLRRLVALRARTAREGVEIACRLLAEFGYGASGRLLTIADPQEAWVICLVHGKHWAAVRVPDDKVLVVANTYPIHRVDAADRANFRLSPGLIEHATERGWYDAKRDGEFDFARAFAAPASRLNPRNFKRQWRGIRLISDEPAKLGPDLPAFVTPRKKLTPADLMAVLRDHYEGTDLDLTEGYRQGTPNRTAERTICTDATMNAVVFQLRASLTPAVGALMWIAMRRPDGSVFLPWYVGMRGTPPGFADGEPVSAFDRHLKPEATALGNPDAYHVFADLCGRLDDDYGRRFPVVRAAREKLEASFFRLQPSFEAEAARLLGKDPEAGRDFITAYVYGQTARAVEAARKLSARFDD